jgi:hypothetical protein
MVDAARNTATNEKLREETMPECPDQQDASVLCPRKLHPWLHQSHTDSELLLVSVNPLKRTTITSGHPHRRRPKHNIVHVRFAPKATVADQNVIRRYVPQPDSCTAANSTSFDHLRADGAPPLAKEALWSGRLHQYALALENQLRHPGRIAGIAGRGDERATRRQSVRVVADRMASASAASFLCRLT